MATQATSLSELDGNGQVLDDGSTAASPDDSTTRIRVKNLYKRFTRGRRDGTVMPADNVSIDFASGEMTTLLGASGSGKTTLLRCIAGLEIPDDGEISMDGRTLFSSRPKVFVPPNKRQLSMVFQNYALWPHMTVFQNVAYAIDRRAQARKNVESKVLELLDRMGLGGLGNQYPGRISGGQQQRVALARAIVREPRAILFDEPLSNVDASVRIRLRLELANLQQSLGFTGIYVTHDQEEAMNIGHRLAVLDGGRIVAWDRPEMVYDFPPSIVVARLVGEMNALDAVVTGAADGGVRATIAKTIPIYAEQPESPKAEPGQWVEGSPVSVAWRPEKGRIQARTPGSPVAERNQIPGRIVQRIVGGANTTYVVRCEGQDSTVQVRTVDRQWSVDDAVSVVVDPGDIRVLRSGTSPQ